MKKILLLATAVASLGLASCDINDVENMGELSTGNFPASQEDGDAVLAGVYMGLNTVNANPQESFLYYAQLASDDCFGGGGTNDNLMQAMDLMCNYNANMTYDFYQQRYESINRANTLIQAIPGLPLDDDYKAQMDGEAKFMRAFYYYELASMYRNVPLRTEPGGETQGVGDETQIWAQILQDLYEAASTMPKTRKTDGHVDRYTAQAMLARAWLFYTGMYCNGATLEGFISTNYSPLTSVELPNGETLTKDMVVDLITECVNESGYELVPDFRNLWAYTNRCTASDYQYLLDGDGNLQGGIKWVEDDNNGSNTNPESMFAIKFNKMASWSTTIGYGNGYALHFGVRGGQDYGNTFPFGQGWGAGPVAPNLINDWKQYEPNDMRRDASVQDWTVAPYNSTYTYGGWEDFVQETDFFAKKWSAITAKDGDSYAEVFEKLMYGADGWENSNLMQTGNIHDLVLIRFADVLLMHSELTETTAGINRVRERAGLEPIGTYSLAALQRERRWELACEGIRWNDIRRWHIAAQALALQQDQPIYYCGTPSTNTAHNGGYAARYNATAGFQKIPENAVAFGVPQNEGWSDASSEYQSW